MGSQRSPMASFWFTVLATEPRAVGVGVGYTDIVHINQR